jgi:hypothetical protein
LVIHFGDEIDRTLVFHLMLALITGAQKFTRAAREEFEIF